MDYLRGPDRSQTQLPPPCVEGYVAPNAPARFIGAFVDGLDMAALGFQRARPAAAVRPGYHPGDPLKLYLYGYLNQIRSSRRLEAEAGRNLERMWLWRALQPDFKTMADFRKDNRPCFKHVFRQFNLLCRKRELFGAELVAIDGAKFKAVNNSRRHDTAEPLTELVEKIEARIDEYLGELDRQDSPLEGVAGRPSPEALQEKRAQWKGRQGQFKYDAGGDRYECPAGQTLARSYQGPSQGKERIYYYNVRACSRCELKGSCTQGSYRKLSRLVNEAVVERQAARVAAHRQIVAKRKTIVEHVFGSLRNGRHDTFLLKGLEKVRAEFRLSALTDNLRRVLNLKTLAEWIAAIKSGGRARTISA